MVSHCPIRGEKKREQGALSPSLRGWMGGVRNYINTVTDLGIEKERAKKRGGGGRRDIWDMEKERGGYSFQDTLIGKGESPNPVPATFRLFGLSSKEEKKKRGKDKDHR